MWTCEFSNIFPRAWPRYHSSSQIFQIFQTSPLIFIRCFFERQQLRHRAVLMSGQFYLVDGTSSSSALLPPSPSSTLSWTTFTPLQATTPCHSWTRWSTLWIISFSTVNFPLLLSIPPFALHHTNMRKIDITWGNNNQNCSEFDWGRRLNIRGHPATPVFAVWKSKINERWFNKRLVFPSPSLPFLGFLSHYILVNLLTFLFCRDAFWILAIIVEYVF